MQSSYCVSKGELFSIRKRVAPHFTRGLASPFPPCLFAADGKRSPSPLFGAGIDCPTGCAHGKRHPVQCPHARIASHILNLLVSRPSPTPSPSPSLPPYEVIPMGFFYLIYEDDVHITIKKVAHPVWLHYLGGSSSRWALYLVSRVP